MSNELFSKKSYIVDVWQDQKYIDVRYLSQTLKPWKRLPAFKTQRYAFQGYVYSNLVNLASNYC